MVLGKTVTTEFATFFPGKTANPHNPAHTPGGSSSGSAAAVGAGMVPLAFATQTAGSIIRPAAYCGVVGYKPSFGLIPRAGVKALADSLDTIGVMASRVEDAAFFAGILGERRALRDAAMPAAPPRFGFYPTPMWGAAEAPTVAALDHARIALARAGARVDEIAVPPGHQGLTEAQNTVMGHEMVGALAFERIYHSAELSPRLGQMLDAGMAVGTASYDAALAEAATARAALPGFFGACDALLVPAAPGTAPAGLGYTGDPVFNRMWTLLGAPCVTIPAIRGEGGLPVGVQLVGRIGDDARLMECALFAERVLAEAA
jgi:amidase